MILVALAWMSHAIVILFFFFSFPFSQLSRNDNTSFVKATTHRKSKVRTKLRPEILELRLSFCAQCQTFAKNILWCAKIGITNPELSRFKKLSTNAPKQKPSFLLPAREWQTRRRVSWILKMQKQNIAQTENYLFLSTSINPTQDMLSLVIVPTLFHMYWLD